MVEKQRQGTEREEEITRLRPTLRRDEISEVRAKAEYGVRAYASNKGPMNIMDIVEAPGAFEATFAHHPDLEKSATGGLGIVWVLIPRQDKTEEIPQTAERLKGLMRHDAEEEKDHSKN